MKLFGQIIRTAVNAVTVPVAVARDVLFLGLDNAGKSHTVAALEKLKREAGES